MRVTWVQPEDLVGHELNQAREEGKDVAEIEARWLAAGGKPAPARGASQEPASPEVRALAEEILDELGAVPAREHDTAAPGSGPIERAADVGSRIRSAWEGRAAGCVLGKPVEGLPREGIRAIAESTGNWPVREYFTGVGLDPEVAARWPWNRASRATSLREVIAGVPEDDDLNFTMLALRLLERVGSGFTSLDVAKEWLDFLPPGRIFTAERVACRNLLLGLLPPETATYRNPFREWIGARLRVDAYGWVAGGDPGRAASMAREDAAVSHTANGIHAAAFMAAAHAATLSDVTAAEAADIGLAFVPASSRLAEAIRFARDVPGDWEDVVDALHARYGALHWVHAVNNTALVAAAMYRFTSFDEAAGAVVSAGWDTDTNGAAVGSIYGALGRIDERWTAPLHGRFASSLPSFDSITLDELVDRTLALV